MGFPPEGSASKMISLGNQMDTARSPHPETLAIAGHDLRASIATLRVLSEELMEVAGNRMSEFERDLLSKVISSGDLALRLADDLVDLATGEIGLMKLSCEPVDVTEAVEQIISPNNPV